MLVLVGGTERRLVLFSRPTMRPLGKAIGICVYWARLSAYWCSGALVVGFSKEEVVDVSWRNRRILKKKGVSGSNLKLKNDHVSRCMSHETNSYFHKRGTAR